MKWEPASLVVVARITLESKGVWMGPASAMCEFDYENTQSVCRVALFVHF
jgi:hypothetical protein